jgi:hypothetical protein
MIARAPSTGRPRRPQRMTTNPRTQPLSLAARTALLVALLALLAPLAVSQASAASVRYDSQCWRQVVNDWFVDGRVDGTYPVGCYTQAIAHVNQFEDVKAYSSASDDIRRALLAAVRQDRGGGQSRSDFGGGPTGSSNGPTDPTGGAGATSNSSHQGWFRAAIDKVGPSNAESVPLPLLILGGIALLLVAAAAASVAARRLQARRAQPAPASVPRPPNRP